MKKLFLLFALLFSLGAGAQTTTLVSQAVMMDSNNVAYLGTNTLTVSNGVLLVNGAVVGGGGSPLAITGVVSYVDYPVSVVTNILQIGAPTTAPTNEVLYASGFGYGPCNGAYVLMGLNAYGGTDYTNVYSGIVIDLIGGACYMQDAATHGINFYNTNAGGSPSDPTTTWQLDGAGTAPAGTVIW